jgi:amino-acid N-acetyltransferase
MVQEQEPDALPPGCILRPARAADAARIRVLGWRARLDPTQLRWPQFLIIVCDGEVIACGQLRRFRGAQELGSLVVLPAWQGRGLGGALVRALVRRATRPLFLECQGALVPYYTRFGFVSVPWRAVPGPLRWKFGLSHLLAALVRRPVASMAYRPKLQPQPPIPNPYVRRCSDGALCDPVAPGDPGRPL